LERFGTRWEDGIKKVPWEMGEENVIWIHQDT
jgi:hypothetical protein